MYRGNTYDDNIDFQDEELYVNNKSSFFVPGQNSSIRYQSLPYEKK